MQALQQPVLSAQTSASGPCEGFILTKVSNAGFRYFFTGTHTEIETMEGEEAYVAGTSLFHGDARFYASAYNAEAISRGLNRCGIGGVDWDVTPVRKLAGGWVLDQ